MPPAIKLKSHNSNIERVMMRQEDVKRKDVFQRENRSVISQTSKPVRDTWAKKRKNPKTEE